MSTPIRAPPSRPPQRNSLEYSQITQTQQLAVSQSPLSQLPQNSSPHPQMNQQRSPGPNSGNISSPPQSRGLYPNKQNPAPFPQRSIPSPQTHALPNSLPSLQMLNSPNSSPLSAYNSNNQSRMNPSAFNENYRSSPQWTRGLAGLPPVVEMPEKSKNLSGTLRKKKQQVYVSATSVFEQNENRNVVGEGIANSMNYPPKNGMLLPPPKNTSPSFTAIFQPPSISNSVLSTSFAESQTHIVDIKPPTDVLGPPPTRSNTSNFSSHSPSISVSSTAITFPDVREYEATHFETVKRSLVRSQLICPSASAFLTLTFDDIPLKTNSQDILNIALPYYMKTACLEFARRVARVIKPNIAMYLDNTIPFDSYFGKAGESIIASSLYQPPPIVGSAPIIAYLLVKNAKLTDEYEPVFLSIALYNIETKKKLSENFDVDPNSQFSLAFTSLSKTAMFDESKPRVREGMFIIPEADESTFQNYHFVIRGYRAFIGDNEKDANVYKKDTLPEETKKYFGQSISVQSQRWPETLPMQPYFWNSFPVYTSKDSLNKSVIFKSCYFTKTSISDEIICETIKDKTKNTKNLPVVLVISVGTSSTSSVSLDRSMLPKSEISHLLETGKQFKLFEKDVTPFYVSNSHTDYAIEDGNLCNDLYVYPLGLSLKEQANYIISFELIHRSQPNSRTKFVYQRGYTFSKPIVQQQGKKSMVFGFAYEGYSSVQYKDNNPVFSDEIKIKVPLNFYEYRLHATIMSISADSDQKNVVGFAALDLIEEGHFIADQQYNLKVYDKSENLHSKPLKESELKKRSKTLSIRTYLNSSVIPRSYPIQSFFLSCDETMANSNFDKLRNLTKTFTYSSDDSHSSDLTRFFPFIAHIHMKCIRSVDPQKAKEAVSSFVWMANIISQNTTMSKNSSFNTLSPILMNYVENIFNPLAYLNANGEGIHIPFASILNELTVTRKNEIEDSAHNFWFLLRIITKSAICCASNAGLLSNDFNRSQRFPSYFDEHVASIIRTVFRTCLSQVEKTSLNLEELFQIFNDLLLVVDRGKILNEVYRFVGECTHELRLTRTIIHNTIIRPLLFSFIQNPLFVQMNFPICSPEILINSDNYEQLSLDFYKAFPLAGVILYYLERSFTNNVLRSISLKVLKDILKVIYFDTRFVMKDVQRDVVSVFFPFVSFFLSHRDEIMKFDDSVSFANAERCFGYIMTSLTPSLFKGWWKTVTPKMRALCFRTLRDVALNFYAENDAKRICELIATTLAEHRNDLLNSIGVTFTEIIALILELFDTVTEYKVPEFLFPIVRILHQQYAHALFKEGHFQGIALALLCLMNADANEHRERATALFCDLIKSAKEVYTKSFESLKSQLTIAASKMIGLTLCETNCIQNSLNSVLDSLKNEPANFRDQVSPMITTVKSLVSNYERMNQTNNPETILNLYFERTESYSNSPTLLVIWLSNLESKLDEYNKYEEAAICSLHLAYVHSLLLDSSDQYLASLLDFNYLLPNLKRNVLVPSITEGIKYDASKVSDLVSALQSAESSFKKAELFEMAIKVSNILTQIYLHTEDTLHLCVISEVTSTSSRDLNKLMAQLRIFSKFFRASFVIGANYANYFPELNNKTFIYKMPPESNLGTFTTYIKEFLSANAPSDALVLVSNNETLTSPPPNLICYQIASVDPYFDESELAANRKAIFSQHFGINQFLMNQAFSQSKKAIVDNVGEQQKKKTIYTVRYFFPFVLNRLDVVDSKEIILSPIENAIEQINDRCAALRQQLLYNPPKINALQQVLQGIVLPMVNEGPIKICEVFLSKKNPNDQFQHQLSFSMCTLFNLCGYALQRAFESLEHITKLHETLESSFRECRKKVSPLLCSDHQLLSEYSNWTKYKELPKYKFVTK